MFDDLEVGGYCYTGYTVGDFVRNDEGALAFVTFLKTYGIKCGNMKDLPDHIDYLMKDVLAMEQYNHNRLIVIKRWEFSTFVMTTDETYTQNYYFNPETEELLKLI